MKEVGMRRSTASYDTRSPADHRRLAQALVHGSELRTDSPFPEREIKPLGNCPASRGGSSC